MKRLIFGFTGFLIAASILSGCSNTTSSNSTDALSGKSKNRILFGTNRTDKVDQINDLAKTFTSENPGTKVEVEAIFDPDTTLKTRMAANELPDITLVLGDIQRDRYPKFFAPIDDLGFTEDTINFYKYGVNDKDGKLYTLNSSIGYFGVVYSKLAFKQAGIDRVPTTKDEFFEACKKLKAVGIVPVASNFKDKWTLSYFAFNVPTAWNANSTYADELCKTETPLADDNGMLDGIKFLRELKDKKYLENDLMSTNWDSSKGSIARGATGMMLIGTWFPPQMIENGAKPEDVGMFPVPDSKALIASGDWAFAVSANSKNVNRAKSFLKYCFENSRYQKTIGVMSPMKGAEQSEPWVQELLSSNLPIKDGSPSPFQDHSKQITNKARINWGTVIQEYLTASKPKTIVDKYNKLWSDTKKSLGK